MKIYNVTGYSLIVTHLLASGLAAPPQWGFINGMLAGLAYLTFIWFFGGLYLSDVMHMGIAHKTLDYKPWFIKSVVLFYNVLGIYINPTTWVNRHRHHHAFSDHDGDPNKLDDDGFWRTMYLCIFPYPCKSNLAKDPIFQSWPLRLTSSRYFQCLFPGNQLPGSLAGSPGLEVLPLALGECAGICSLDKHGPELLDSRPSLWHAAV